MNFETFGKNRIRECWVSHSMSQVNAVTFSSNLIYVCDPKYIYCAMIPNLKLLSSTNMASI